jgi:hypothetical protein
MWQVSAFIRHQHAVVQRLAGILRYERTTHPTPETSLANPLERLELCIARYAEDV